MSFLPTNTMGTKFLRLGPEDGPHGRVVSADDVSSLNGYRPDRRMVHFVLGVRARRPLAPLGHTFTSI